MSRLVKQTAAGALDDVFQRLAFVFSAGSQLVQFGDVGVVVFAVVEVQCLGRDMGFQSILFLRQCG